MKIYDKCVSKYKCEVEGENHQYYLNQKSDENWEFEIETQSIDIELPSFGY